MRRLERFFATLPERERQVIDAYLGIGLTPVELARSMQVTRSRVSQMFTSICDRIGIHLGHTGHRSSDRAKLDTDTQFDARIAQRESELREPQTLKAWSELVEVVLTAPRPADLGGPDNGRLTITGTTRWG